VTKGTDAASEAHPGRMPGIPRSEAPKASAAKDHSRARQDAKRRGNMDAERLT